MARRLIHFHVVFANYACFCFAEKCTSTERKKAASNDNDHRVGSTFTTIKYTMMLFIVVHILCVPVGLAVELNLQSFVRKLHSLLKSFNHSTRYVHVDHAFCEKWEFLFTLLSIHYTQHRIIYKSDIRSMHVHMPHAAVEMNELTDRIE